MKNLQRLPSTLFSISNLMPSLYSSKVKRSKPNYFKTNRKTLLFVLITIIITSCNKESNLFNATELLETGDTVVSPPSGFDPFYKKYINANGIPITSSEKVKDEALIRARHTVINMLAKRPDVLAQMILHNARVGIIAQTENTADLPEYADVEDPEEFNQRARGYGGTPSEPFVSCAEENIMRVGYDYTIRPDAWNGYDVLIHEFAHSIHLIGLVNTIPDFQSTLENLFNHAQSKGLWNNTYAITNEEEYFAECVQSWFNAKSTQMEGPRDGNGLQNDINTRDELKSYDPKMYELLKTIFYDNNWEPIPFPF